MKLKQGDMIYDAVLLPKSVSSYQTSDKVSSGVIKSCVSDCRDQIDCHITVRYLGGTLMGTNSYYDSDGHLVVEDCNTSNYEATCRVCWKSWTIKQYPDYEDKQCNTSGYVIVGAKQK
jgi:hypothetical protein